MIREAKCTECGETFVPLDDDDLEHIQHDDGTECGGAGIMLGHYDQSAVDGYEPPQ